MVHCCEVALRLRELFGAIGLRAYPKTSGSKGLQVYVPLNRDDASYETTKPQSAGLPSCWRSRPQRRSSREWPARHVRTKC